MNSQAPIPFTDEQVKEEGRGFYYQGKKYIHHTTLPHEETALYRFTPLQRILLVVFAVSIVVSFITNWHLSLLVFISGLSFLYFFDLLFNFFLVFTSFSSSADIHITDEELRSLRDEDLPTYAILCPLYREWQVLPQFVKAMSALDYPKEKLNVMLLLEEDDEETVRRAREMNLPSYFSIHVVPQSYPKTKPKACNYGLTKATSEYLVIYDAEDIPETDQLKKAVIAFQKTGERTVCIQAKLNFYNPRQNTLTRLFTAEYSLWFDLVLTGLQSINAPIPLGGTSNHFIVEKLRSLHGWDSFNVTEDADLGVRLAKYGYQTAIVDSTTMEEANSSLPNWFKQRSRWIKGYIQTYFVAMRNPLSMSRKWNIHQQLLTQLIIGGKILSLLINPIMWLMTLLYFVFRAQTGPFIESLFPPIIFYISILSLLFGNFLYVYYYLIGVIKREHWDIAIFVFLIPIYWLMLSVASGIAIWEFILRPHEWNKTKHGLHLPQEDLSLTI